MCNVFDSQLVCTACVQPKGHQDVVYIESLSGDELPNSEAGTLFYAPVIRSLVLTYTSVKFMAMSIVKDLQIESVHPNVYVG